jgi:hypothetical protein
MDAQYCGIYFQSSNYNEIFKGKKIEELIDVEKAEVDEYEKELNMAPEFARIGDLLKHKDVFVKYPGQNESPLKDGWSGLYRIENGVWKMVAGSLKL